MISPLRPWNIRENNFKGKSHSIKYDSTTCSSEDSLNVHKPLLKSGSHFELPNRHLNQNDLPTVNEDEIHYFSSNKENMSPANDGSSEELFRPQSDRFKGLSPNTYNRQIFDKVFSQYDPFGKLPLPVTPKLSTPKTRLLSPSTPKSCSSNPRVVTQEARATLRKAALEGQKEFVKILENNGIDPNEYFAPTLSSKKKSSKKVNFLCSTPQEYSAIEICDTPLEKSSIIETPLSGFKNLTLNLNGPEDSPLSPNYSVPSTPLSSCASDVSLKELSSPDKEDLPPDVKATLLSGIVCFVDCRSENEDRTESVKAELISLGARIEKNFTKKVTHVVFKEGRMSTFIKAKKENIPIVGVLWIEACKRARGIADPALHRPRKMQKYDKLLPYQMITKRRIAILNPNSRVRRNLMVLCGETPPPLPEKRKRTRKAETEVKDIRKRVAEVINQDKHCHKRLFDNCLENDKNFPSQNLNNVNTIDSSGTDNSDAIKEAAKLRRKSAPGKLLSKKSAKNADIKQYFSKIQPEASKPNVCDNENDISSIRKEFENLKTDGKNDDSVPYIYGVTPSTQDKKRRKLFDPNESLNFSQKTESETTTDEPYLATPKRARTKATCGSRPMKLAISRKLQANIRINEDFDKDSSPSGNWFVTKPESGSQSLKQQKQPSISFTSIPKNELSKYIDIVNKLGKFSIDEKVTRFTTHVVSNGPRRTINLIKGIARGCWLVDIKWILESEASGKWLSPEDYDLSFAFPAAAECCKVRRSLKSSRVVDIFKGSGKIYVSRKLKSSPHFSDIEELLRICGATLASSSADADIVIGKKGSKPTMAVYVSAKWVLDCVTQNLLLPFHDFIEQEPLSQATDAS